MNAGDPTDPHALPALLETLYSERGFDFRRYAPLTVRRRVAERVLAEQAGSIAGLHDRALRDGEVMNRLLQSLSVHVTSMFRDPLFWWSFRRKVVPVLRTWPFVRIWHAGCSTGEEVYSMAVLLAEEGLYDRCRVYATDISESVLARARLGTVPLASMQEYTANYLSSGGKSEFSEYYTPDPRNPEQIILRPSLRDNVVFAQHNLATDRSFNEFNVVVCRNVMIYFNRALQDHVHGLLHESLGRSGFLALGRKEDLRFTPHEHGFDPIDPVERIWRRAD